jgi:secreted PhoX family phosphatase
VNRKANRDLLDEGTLYVARFNADGTGNWLPLVGADAAIRTRQAADAAGATKMDRPEWIVPHPATREVFASLTNNRDRKAADPANPRAPNPFGHILRWREEGDDVAATRFRWDVFVLAGPEGKSSIHGDAFACPDALWIDSMGTLWVQTDMSGSALGRGDFAPLGNNQALAVDPSTGVFRRFLTGPRGCEITGFHVTPDNRTAFVNIQHPGETPGGRSNPDNPSAISNWPDLVPGGRPRSSTVVIRRKDGGIIGT